jgi:hypothetical protein
VLVKAENIELFFVIIPVSLDTLEDAGHRGMSHRIDMDQCILPGYDIAVSPDKRSYFFFIYGHMSSSPHSGIETS